MAGDTNRRVPAPSWLPWLGGLLLASTALAQAPTPEPAPAPPSSQPPMPPVPPAPADDTPWEGLTPARQAWFRSKYEDMPADEEPPYPIHGELRLYRLIQETVASYAMELTPGRVKWRLAVTVAPDGRVSALTIIQVPDQNIAMAVGHALLSVPFKPGRCHGKPCQMDFPIDFVVDLIYRP